MKMRKKPLTVTLTEEQVVLSEERTLLSRERTILSFMQTAIAFIGIGLVIVNVFQEFNTELIGWGLVAIGIVEIVESARRIINNRKAMIEIKKRKAKMIKLTGV